MLSTYLVSHAVTVLTSLASLGIALRLFRLRRSPQSLLAWLLAVVFVPFVAIPLYLLLGARKFPMTAKLPDEGPDASGRAAAKRDPCGPETHAVRRVLRSTAAPDARAGNRFELLTTGEAAYGRLLDLIAGATTSIHVTVFILGNDETGHGILDALAQRARDGLEVKLILDAVGSRPMLTRARRALAAAGGEARAFMPLLHAPVRGRSNLRSHRKLVVVDGARAFFGGMNFALEYMGKSPYAARFRDLAAVAEGPVAGDIEALFASDWAFCGGGALRAPRAFEAPRANDASATATMQLVPSGPDMRDDTFYDAMLTAIGAAERRIALVTAYYVPDENVQRALVLAARRGVRTTLVVPTMSNHALADFARRGLARELVAAGVELRGYARGMVHAKALVVDDDFAYVGSPNFDMRSFFLNYEDAVFLYDRASVASVAAAIDSLAAESEHGLGDKRPHWIFEQMARLLAPEL